jgi:hypothetical protein
MLPYIAHDILSFWPLASFQPPHIEHRAWIATATSLTTTKRTCLVLQDVESLPLPVALPVLQLLSHCRPSPPTTGEGGQRCQFTGGVWLLVGQRCTLSIGRGATAVPLAGMS